MRRYELNGTWTKQRPHPKFKDTVIVSDFANLQLGKLDDDRRNLIGIGSKQPEILNSRARDGSQGPHASKVRGKLYWPHMTNPMAQIPLKVRM